MYDKQEELLAVVVNISVKALSICYVLAASKTGTTYKAMSTSTMQQSSAQLGAETCKTTQNGDRCLWICRKFHCEHMHG